MKRQEEVSSMCSLGMNGLAWEAGGLSPGSWWNWLDCVDDYVK